MASNRKIQESSSKTLRDLASIHENRFCFDCNQRGPTYVNMSIGSFVCTGCGGALRKYNQRVKSISMSNFSPQEINFMKRRGNKACRKIYLALCGGQEPDERSSNFDDYLRLKYQVQKWYQSPDPETEEEALKENEEALNRTTQSPAKKVAHIGANAAAGLIILTNRSLPTLLPAPSANTEQTSTAAASATEPANSSTQSATRSQPFSPFTSDSGAPFPDPFDELIAARPSATLPAAPPAIAATAQSQPPPLPPPPQQQQQLPQPQPSFASFALPTFPPSTVSQPPPPPSTASASTAWPVLFPPSDTFSSAPPPMNSAFATASPAPAPADKYAALAELDRMGKAEGNHEPPRSNAVSGLASASFASFKPQPLNPFTSPGPNPFQAPTVGAHNPFATAPAAPPTNSFSLFQSNTANGGTAFSTASFNPFINAR